MISPRVGGSAAVGVVAPSVPSGTSPGPAMSGPEAWAKPDEGKKEGEAEAAAGELLYCGGTSWETMGRRSAPVGGNLLSPTRVRPLMGVDIRFVSSGCSEHSSLFYISVLLSLGSLFYVYAFGVVTMIFK